MHGLFLCLVLRWTEETVLSPSRTSNSSDHDCFFLVLEWVGMAHTKAHTYGSAWMYSMFKVAGAQAYVGASSRIEEVLPVTGAGAMRACVIYTPRPRPPQVPRTYFFSHLRSQDNDFNAANRFSSCYSRGLRTQMSKNNRHAGTSAAQPCTISNFGLAILL